MLQSVQFPALLILKHRMLIQKGYELYFDTVMNSLDASYDYQIVGHFGNILKIGKQYSPKEYFEKLNSKAPAPFNKTDAEATAKEMTEKAIKVIRDRHNLLPVEINKNSRILHLVIYNYWNREFKVVGNIFIDRSILKEAECVVVNNENE